MTDPSVLAGIDVTNFL